MERSPSLKKDGACGVGEGLSTRTLAAIPGATNPSLHTTLVPSALPQPEARVSGCKIYFVCCPFKKVPGTLADSPLFLVDRVPPDFLSLMLCGCLFPAPVLWAGVACMGLRHYAPQGGPLPLRYLSKIPATTCGSGVSPFHICPPCLPVSMWLLP